jgi:hypothetical protein
VNWSYREREREREREMKLARRRSIGAHMFILLATRVYIWLPKVKASNGWVASFDVDSGEGCYFVWSYCCHCPCNLGSIVLTVEGIMDWTCSPSG